MTSSASSSTTPTAAFWPVVGLLLLLLLVPRGAAAIGAVPGPYPPFDACGELLHRLYNARQDTMLLRPGWLHTSCTGFLEYV
jgi:hypothetical protein